MKLFAQSVLLVFGLTLCQNSFAVSDLRNCREDVAKFCSDVKKGAGRISRCLAEHASELTSTCRKSAGLGGGPEIPTAVEPKGQSRGEVSQKSYTDIQAVCLSEIRSFCWDTKEGDARGTTDCLNKHKENLGKECTKVLSAGRP